MQTTTRQFIAFDAGKNRYDLVAEVEMVDAGSKRFPSAEFEGITRTIKTAEGRPIVWLAKGQYRIDSPNGSFHLTSDDPRAP